MKHTKIFSLLVLLLSIFSLSENLLAQKRKPRPPRTISSIAVPKRISPELQRRIDAFNFAWQTIKNNYFDQTFSGLDWDKIKKEYEPPVLKTVSDDQLHDIIQEMINRLERSHFAVIPPEVFQALENAKTEAKAKERQQQANEEETVGEETVGGKKFDLTGYGAKFGIGVDLRLIENRFVITLVDKNSTAEKAGLKTGYIVEKINGVSLAELLGKLEKHYANVRNIKRYLPAQIIEFMLDGEKESFVTLVCLNETGQPTEIIIQREQLKGESISIGQNYPEVFMRFESASLNDEVGFIKFNLFALPTIEKFCRALTELKDKKAIIIDLRGNTGGIIGSMVGLSGMLTEKSIDLGTSIYKVGSENLVGLSKPKNYKGKLVFLVDNQTVSAGEIFAAALQENNRALIVGEKTAGEALPSVSVELPTGAVLIYPIANYKTRNGTFLEGRGVEPNFVVALDRKSLLDGKDAQLETALRIIKEDKAFPKLLDEPVGLSGKIKPPPPPPPAPRAAIAPKGKVLGEVTILAPPTAKPKETVNKKDEKALQVITDFIGLIGGAEALNKINSYTLSGTVELNVRGSKTELEINIYRQKPDRYAELLSSASIGEIRQIYNGKKSLVQADYGYDRDLPFEADTADIEIFAPLYNLLKKDSFKSLIYQGIFERQSRKVHLVEIVTKDDMTIALAFDVETKLLVSYVRLFYGISFGDYRRVENVMLPFRIERESIMDIKLDEIKLNPAIEAGVFMKKENCFDKVD